LLLSARTLQAPKSLTLHETSIKDRHKFPFM
jgi:hypothetical protein